MDSVELLEKLDRMAADAGAAPELLIQVDLAREATKFGVKIRIKEKEPFRPGMSVTAEIETRSRTNALTVPIASVTTRLPKDKKLDAKTAAVNDPPGTNGTVAKTNSLTPKTNSLAAENANTKGDKKSKEAAKPIEVVFVLEGERVKMVPVKIGISDDTHWEITDGLKEGQEVISGGYRAISRDLDEGKKVRKGTVVADAGSETKKAD